MKKYAFFATLFVPLLTITMAFNPLDDVATLVWGDKVTATSKSITVVKTKDFKEVIPQTIAFQANEKPIEGVSAHVNIFPLDAASDPIQVDLIQGVFDDSARSVLQNYAKWGTKIFIEQPQFLQKGKLKTLPTIIIKLN